MARKTITRRRTPAGIMETRRLRNGGWSETLHLFPSYLSPGAQSRAAKAKVKKRRKLTARETAHGIIYAARERRYQELLRRKARSRRDHGTEASVDGVEVQPRYTQEQLAQLQAEGKALRKRNGSYGWGCADRRDLLNCVAAWNRGEAGSEASVVKAFIKRRGVLMKMEDLLPAASKVKVPTSAGPRQ